MCIYLGVHTCTIYVQMLQKVRRGHGSPRAGFTVGCELPFHRGCWELNQCLLEVQQVFITTEPFPQTLNLTLKFVFRKDFKER